MIVRLKILLDMSKIVITTANVITSSLVAIGNKYEINSLKLLSPKILAELIKLLDSSKINKQGLEAVLDSLAQEVCQKLSSSSSEGLQDQNDLFGNSVSDGDSEIKNHILEPGEFYFKEIDIQKMVSDMGLIQVSDDSALKPIVDQVISQNQSQIDQYKSGKVQVLGFLVGQCMKLNKSGSPAKYSELLKESLGG